MRNNIAWLTLAALALAGCGDKTAGTSGGTIGVAFESDIDCLGAKLNGIGKASTYFIIQTEKVACLFF